MSDALDTVMWFEVATEDPEGAQRFYGELFGWTFAADPGSAEAGMDYRLITYPGAQAPSGGIFATGGKMRPHAIFSVAVADVEAACERVEKLGGTVTSKVVGAAGGPDFAYVTDPAGNLFGLFAPK
ncbi:hypothetical protein HNP84_004967 [Thermocatellispora tengchongensis]|uniref:VOC domain-containing protein n=1 Tax=Thermocatellispora tengchongensis TaxID=1073253 RepID=A0A840PBK9_9ACTN|nr:VOC family protein [Thermocatellispora tengchongensis]MBB5135231.1 hypothetical protein [Thermocatellispora tengchongensis]